MFGISVGSYLENYHQYRIFMRTFCGCSPKDYGEYLAGRKNTAKHKKRRKKR